MGYIYFIPKAGVTIDEQWKLHNTSGFNYMSF